MREERSVFRLFGLFGVVLLMAGVVGCAGMPQQQANAPKGVAAVKVASITSSNGAVHTKSNEGKSFFIKSKDTTDKGIDLNPSLVKALQAMGMHQASNENDAYYVIDYVAENYSAGKVSAASGVQEAQQAIVGDNAGAAIIGNIIAAGYPSTVTFDVDLVVDELVPAPPTYKTVRKNGKRVQIEVPADPSNDTSVQTKTVLTGAGQYMVSQATEADAVSAVSTAVSDYIVGMFK